MGRPRGGEAVIAARLRAATGLSSERSYALAWFLDAEGHFGISAKGDNSPRCFASIQLREDDAAILHEFRNSTGCGQVTYMSARGSSKPQARWQVGSKLECQVLVEILDKYPLLGRKRHEARLWCRAVERWGGPAGDRRTIALRVAAAELKRIRRYREGFIDTYDTMPTEAHLIGHFGGFFSGDGSLKLDPPRRRAQILIKLRRDDIGLLEVYRDQFGFGRTIPVKAFGKQNPCALWHVSGRSQLLEAITVLDRAPLLGMKRLQYEAWRPAAQEIAMSALRGRQPDTDVLAEAGVRLAALRRYNGPSRRLTCLECDSADGSQVYLTVLRSWSRLRRGPLTCTAYSDARRDHPTWPTRGTLIANYGSWRGALAAAGLADRALPARRSSAADQKVASPTE